MTWISPKAKAAIGVRGYVATLLWILISGIPLSLHPAAAAGSTIVSSMGATFVSNLPASWTSVQGAWSYFNVQACWQSGTSCEGNNPATPYGSPTFPLPSGTQSKDFQLNPNDAVVIFCQTPPPSAYYAFTQYLTSEPGIGQVYASLSDSLNLMELSTLGSTGPGQNMFGSYAVIVWTANVNTYNRIVGLLAKQGISASNVNFIPIPINMGTYPGWTGPPLPPLEMGTGFKDAVFSMLMRIALPASQTALQNYMTAMPFFVLKVSPPASLALSAAPSVGFANETTGILESTSQQTMPMLQQALSNLVSDIQASNGMLFNFSSLPLNYNTINGWQCILDDSQCGDNHDELSGGEPYGAVTVKNLNDVVIIAGVNHVATNKGLYFNHTVYDPTNQGAVASVSSQTLNSASALYWAGVTNPSDPRVQEYQSLYAYAISYDCTGLQYCLTIPVVTPTNSIGLTPGAPFQLFGRATADPARIDPPLGTFVRPSATEIVTHQVLLGTHN